MITINVNAKEYQFKNTITLQEVIIQLDIQTSGIAVAINQEIISKNTWQTTQLQQNDTVLIIKATQGG